MILWSLYTFLRKYIVNLEIKAIEVKEKLQMFNKLHPWDGGRAGAIALETPNKIHPSVSLSGAC